MLCSQEVLCHTVHEAIDAFRGIGGPVAVKLISPEIPHKTEARIIQLNVDHETAIRHAYRDAELRFVSWLLL
ncbi:acetate--CoA ligase family protein [Candidatus Bipolaricaulota bacterium]|nr:acetate--CoA ligase family protein [Candidatus Bipolaricaulota bacterium]